MVTFGLAGFLLLFLSGLCINIDTHEFSQVYLICTSVFELISCMGCVSTASLMIVPVWPRFVLLAVTQINR